ncbi:MAG: PAS domain-containing protein [Ardenticatenales bacterium]
MPETAARLLDGPGPILLLALAWPTLAAVRRWRSAGGTSPVDATSAVGRADARLLAGISLAAALILPLDIALGLPALAAWQAPLDRLFGGLFVGSVVLAVLPSRAQARRAARLALRRSARIDVRDPRTVTLAVLFALAVPALAVWSVTAATWAGGDRTGAASAEARAILADVALAAGALVLALAAARRAGASARATLPVLGALALGSALQALRPMPGPALLWRIGLLAAGASAALAAAGEAGLRDRRRDGADGMPGGRWYDGLDGAAVAGRFARWSGALLERALAAVTAALGRAGRRARAFVGVLAARVATRLMVLLFTARTGMRRTANSRSARARLALARTVGGVLSSAIDDLDAAVAYVGLLEGDVVRFWALTPSGALQELYGRPLSQLPTLRRTLRTGTVTLLGRAEARDVDDLFGQLDLGVDGPILLTPCGRPAQAVLVAARGSSPWRRADADRLCALADTLASRLSELGDAAAAPSAAPPVASADEVGQLRAVVAAMHADLSQYGARLEGLERRLDGQTAAPDGFASAGLLVPSPAASYLARLETYQRLLEPLPWGLVVADADGRVLLANSAARRLLVGSALLPGHRLDIPGPGARTLVHSLRDPSSALTGTRVVLQTLDAVLRVESIDRPNWRHRNRLGATLVVATAAEAAAGGEHNLVDLLEALRDPLVDLRIQGESIDGAVRMPSADLMRHLAVLDGHAAALRAILGALMARRRLAANQAPPELAPLDLGALGATTERSLRDLFELRGIRFRGVRGSIPDDVRIDRGTLEQVALAVVVGAATKASWGSHLSVQLRHEPDTAGRDDAIVVVVEMVDGGLTPMTQRLTLDAEALARHPAALRVAHALALQGFPGFQAWFTRQAPDDQRLQLCLRVPVRRAA